MALDLGLIGNCCVSALVDRNARIVWYCLPRFDGDPVFHGLLGAPRDEPGSGIFSIELDDQRTSHQSYVENTAILKTVLEGASGAVEITDFCPRFYSRGRAFRPQMLVRKIVPLSGNPKIRIRVRPRFKYGSVRPGITYGSNHIRYVSEETTIRLTTDAPLDYVVGETAFTLNEPIHLV